MDFNDNENVNACRRQQKAYKHLAILPPNENESLCACVCVNSILCYMNYAWTARTRNT